MIASEVMIITVNAMIHLETKLFVNSTSLTSLGLDQRSSATKQHWHQWTQED